MRIQREALPAERSLPAWRSSLSIEEQVKSNPPEGEGVIRRLQTTEEFRPIWNYEVTDRYPNDAEARQRLLNLFELVTNLPGAKKKRRTGAEAGAHYIRPAIKALQDPTLSDKHAAILMLHDTIEDCEQTPESVADLARQSGWEADDAKDIKIGVVALTRTPKLDGTKMTQLEYIVQLLTMSHNYPHLFIGLLKTFDSTDSMIDDMFALGHNPDVNVPTVAKYALGKGGDFATVSVIDAPNHPATEQIKNVHNIVLDILRVRMPINTFAESQPTYNIPTRRAPR